MWSAIPELIPTGAGPIAELPLSVRAGGRLAPFVQTLPPVARRLSARALGARARFAWLRPSWARPGELAEYVAASEEQVLVAMFHSMEIVPRASPYAADAQGVDRILGSLEELLRHCAENGIGVVGMTTAAAQLFEV